MEKEDNGVWFEFLEWTKVDPDKYFLKLPKLRCTLFLIHKKKKWYGIASFEYKDDTNKWKTEGYSSLNECKNHLLGELVLGLQRETFLLNHLIGQRL